MKKTLIAFLSICLFSLIVGIGYFLATSYKGFEVFKTLNDGSNTSNTNNQTPQENTDQPDNKPNDDTPEEVAEPLTVSAWIANWDYSKGVSSYNANDAITSVSPTWYYLGGDAAIYKKSTAGDLKLYNLTRQRANKIIPSISNSSASEFSAILNSPSKRKLLITNISNLVTKNRYDGIDIDFEKINGDDRDVFSLFIKELSEELNSKGKILTIAVLAKNEDAIYSFSGTRNAQDWSKLGQYTDEFRIMGYDFEHNSTTSSGAISSLPWLEKVLQYSVKLVSKEKVILGLPLYGYKWQKGASTKAVTWVDVAALEKNWGQKGVLEQTSKEKNLKHGGYDIWYQDLESISYRINLAKKHQIKGVVFWRLGGEDSTIWNLFSE